jgi:soluble lytic murein transglycosylase-like protein
MNFQLPVTTPSLVMRIFSGLLLLGSLQANAVEIYNSTSADGVQRWSTQAADATYIKTSIAEDKPSTATKSVAVPISDVKRVANKGTLEDATLAELLNTINQISGKYNVDPELIEAVIAVESGFNTRALSPKGARGLMQLMPATAKRYGMKNEQELHIPVRNVDMGVRHLKDLLNLHNGQVALAIASYNAGQGAVTKHGQRIPGYRETMLYVPAVMAYMARHANSAQSVVY